MVGCASLLLILSCAFADVPADTMTKALDHFWPAGEPVKSPRKMIVLVGGPSNGNTGNDWTAYRNAINDRKVEVWVYAVGFGTSERALAANIASDEDHVKYLPSSAILSYEAPLAGIAACPANARLCDCTNGWCCCAGPGGCCCPTCPGLADPCSPKVCTAGKASLGCVGSTVTCNDNDMCTNDVCQETAPGSGVSECVHTAVDCDDGKECTIDGCAKSTGCYHTLRTCNDGKYCTNDSCDNSTLGGCVFTPVGGCSNACDAVACSDGVACTDDVCVHDAAGCADVGTGPTDQKRIDCLSYVGGTNNPGGGDQAAAAGLPVYCKYKTKVCPAPPVAGCGTVTCNSTSGDCDFVALNCDDGDPCTDDACVPGQGCENTQINCDQFDKCVTQVCQNGACVDGPVVACDDNNPCTEDSCDGVKGCIHTPIICPLDASQCQEVVGCFPDASQGQAGCVYRNISVLIDFCGNCRGGNVGCFIPASDDTEAASVAVGVIVAVVIAAVVAALLIAFFSKKGYDFYKAKSDLQADALQNNPYFKKNNMGGETGF